MSRKGVKHYNVSGVGISARKSSYSRILWKNLGRFKITRNCKKSVGVHMGEYIGKKNLRIENIYIPRKTKSTKKIKMTE